MAQAVEHHTGHRGHVFGVGALGFPVDGTCQTGDAVIQRRLASRVHCLRFAWGQFLCLPGGRRIFDDLFFKHCGLVLGNGGLGRVSGVQGACEQGRGQADQHQVKAHGHITRQWAEFQSSQA